MIVTLTAIPSAIGSAKYTAITLLLIIEGRMKINGIRRITFLNTAKNNDTLALPIAMKVC